ncbi:hypothetical protein BHM03_00058229 [Ensete ventricosum]|nr:hypothetical protein BHM03_00058229 [Ensete ventricosum]
MGRVRAWVGGQSTAQWIACKWTLGKRFMESKSALELKVLAMDNESSMTTAESRAMALLLPPPTFLTFYVESCNPSWTTCRGPRGPEISSTARKRGRFRGGGAWRWAVRWNPHALGPTLCVQSHSFNWYL